MPTRKTSARGSKPWVAVIMGSSSDLKYMQAAIDVLLELEVPHEAKIVSAHRTPDWMFEYASSAEDRQSRPKRKPEHFALHSTRLAMDSSKPLPTAL